MTDASDIGAVVESVVSALRLVDLEALYYGSANDEG